ncbi:ADP,ATP carrier protein [Turnera subulata]|uniref:Arogenate dehydratase n=1 Tax=Turnera subulata TaxID=218843 RepID=A0A9Q0FMY7_9ROSI|nr:ADP,ATP carrier protein [Turnera subulata]
MALKWVAAAPGCDAPQLRRGGGWGWHKQLSRVWISCRTPGLGSSGGVRCELGRFVDGASKNLNKELGSFPRPLSIAVSTATEDGAKVRISFRGLPGSDSEDAALKAYPKCETVPCSEFEDAFKAVELWLADKAILPIENSSCGSIHQNYDLLLRHRLHIVGEVQLPLNLCLLAMPGVRLEQLKRVISHSQALALSDKFLSKLEVTRESVDDPSFAAEHVASNELRDAAVLASARASEIYGLNILATKIQDDNNIVTRFLVLARDPVIPRSDKSFKTSIVFALEPGPGVLFKALAVFALRGISLTKIESRPQRNKPLRVVGDFNTRTAKKYFDYLFYIDFEASMAEPRVQNALGHLQVGICNISSGAWLLSHGYSYIVALSLICHSVSSLQPAIEECLLNHFRMALISLVMLGNLGINSRL